MICLAVEGDIFYDKNSYILYRQHGNNVVGGHRSLFSKIINNSIFNNKRTHYKWASNLLFAYKNYIDNDNLNLLYSIVNYDKSIWNKFDLIKKLKPYKISLIQRIVIYIAILIEKF
jgi:rhamnosyltransferase